MQRFKQTLIEERKKYMDLVASMKSGERQCFEVDTRTGTQTEVTRMRVSMFEATVQSLTLVIDEITATEYSSSWPTKEWHFTQ